MRDTINEALVMKFVECLPLVEIIHEVGMFAFNENAQLACSLDGVALFNIDVEFLKGDGDIQIENSRLWIVPVEMKTKVASKNVGALFPLVRLDIVFDDIKDEICKQLRPLNHLIQVIVRQ